MNAAVAGPAHADLTAGLYVVADGPKYPVQSVTICSATAYKTGPAEGSIECKDTQEVENTFSTDASVAAWAVSAGVGFSVTWKRSIEMSCRITIPASSPNGPYVLYCNKKRYGQRFTVYERVIGGGTANDRPVSSGVAVQVTNEPEVVYGPI